MGRKCRERVRVEISLGALSRNIALIRFARRLPKHFARNQMQRMPRFSSTQLIPNDN